MINTALQGSNSVNGREKYFKTVNFGVVVPWPGGQRPHFLTGGSWSAGSNPRVATSILFFFVIVFLPFGFLTTDHVSFARFLRKRISSLICYLNFY